MAVLLSLLSAILLILSFPQPNLAFLSWIALVPLLIAIEGQPFRKAFGLSYLTGIIFFLGLLYWVGYVTLPGLVLLVLYLALYFGIFGSVASRYQKKSSVFLIPSLWIVLEFIRSHALIAFGWGLLGYSQWRNLPIIQIADITGAYGVSFLIVMVNVAIYQVIRKVRLSSIVYRLWPSVLVTLLCVGSVLIYGYYKLSPSTINYKPFGYAQGKPSTIRVSLIQGNIPQEEKWDPDLASSILAKYSKLTRLASADEAELIIWPETCIPGWMGHEPRLEEALSELAREVETPILAGGSFWDKRFKKAYNSAFLISEDGVVARYDKLHLVPFGEYIPMERLFGFIKRIDKRVGGGRFSPGKDYTIFQTPQARFGVLICFEDIFPNLVREFLRGRAQFMVNITNDAWFGPRAAPYQHVQAAVLRAVELRTSVARCANTGLSCFIDPKGEIIGRVMDKEGRELFVAGHLTMDISLRDHRSLYSRFGDWFLLLCVLISITSGVGFFLTKR